VGGGDFAAFFAEDVVWTTMETGDQVRGRDEVAAFITSLHSEIFDARPELGNVGYGDGFAVLEAVFVGVHIGEFAGLPATKAEVRLPYCVGYDVHDGLITALRAYFPVTELRRQLAESA
jgi:steroid delta-isomerase-like uncharacterized protein